MHPKAPPHGPVAPPPGEAVGRRGEPTCGGWSTTQWRHVVECLAEAYAHYERRLDDLRAETVERFRRSLERRGLSTERTARPRSGKRPVPGRK